MKPFKTYSSVSTKRDKMMNDFLTKGVQIPELKRKSVTPKIPKKVNLNKLAKAIQDNYDLKDIVYNNDPTQTDWPDRVPDEHIDPNADFIEKTGWKIFRFQPSLDPDAKFFTYKRAVALRILATRFAVSISTYLQGLFVNFKTVNFTQQKISQYFHDGEVYNWFTENINNIYKQHPEYRPVPIEEFKQTGIWERGAAEWREKTKDQILHRLPRRILGGIVLFLCGRINPPYYINNIVVSVAVRLLLGYLGINMILGSVYTLVLEHEGNSVILGITLTKYGAEMTQPELVVRRRDNDKLVRVDMPKVPLDLYLIRQSDLDACEKYEGMDLEDIRKEVAPENDNK